MQVCCQLDAGRWITSSNCGGNARISKYSLSSSSTWKRSRPELERKSLRSLESCSSTIRGSSLVDVERLQADLGDHLFEQPLGDEILQLVQGRVMRDLRLDLAAERLPSLHVFSSR